MRSERDSIRARYNELNVQKRMDADRWLEERHKIQARIEKLTSVNNDNQSELSVLKNRVDSLSNSLIESRSAERAIGVLLKPIGPPEYEDESEDFCIDKYFYDPENIVLPLPQAVLEDTGHISVRDVEHIIPVGWSVDGYMAYYSDLDGPCGGMCGAQFKVFNTKSGELLRLKDYFVDGSDCSLLEEIKNDRANVFKKYQLIPLEKLNLFYTRIFGDCQVEGWRIEIEEKNGKSRVVGFHARKGKVILMEINSRSSSSEFFPDMDCNVGLFINGYLYSPLNKHEIILHLYSEDYCGGFEGSIVYDSYLVSVPLQN
jgi:hypothetical protein